MSDIFKESLISAILSDPSDLAPQYNAVDLLEERTDPSGPYLRYLLSLRMNIRVFNARYEWVLPTANLNARFRHFEVGTSLSLVVLSLILQEMVFIDGVPLIRLMNVSQVRSEIPGQNSPVNYYEAAILIQLYLAGLVSWERTQSCWIRNRRYSFDWIRQPLEMTLVTFSTFAWNYLLTLSDTTQSIRLMREANNPRRFRTMYIRWYEQFLTIVNQISEPPIPPRF